MRAIAILNPAAGHGRAGRRSAAIAGQLRASGLVEQVQTTEAPGHATMLARKAAAHTETVIAVGGDGTIQEVARGLIESGRPTHLGLIPLGTGNDFVNAIGMPPTLEAALDALRTAVPTPVDYGRVRWTEAGQPNERVFVNAVGVGFDARVNIEAVALKGLPGRTGYLAAVLRTLRRWDGPPTRVVGHAAAEAEPEATARLLYDGPLLMVSVGNGDRVGGLFRLTPRASLTDGLLDVCLVEHASPWRILQVLPRAVRGRHEMAREVHTFRVRSLTITPTTCLPVHADGEILAENAQSVEISVVPHGLSVLTPA